MKGDKVTICAFDYREPIRKPEAQHLYPLVMKPLRSRIPQKNHGFLSLFPFPLDQEFNLPLTSPPCVLFGSFNMGLKAAAWPKSWAKHRFIESQHHPSSINRSDSRQWIHKSLSTGHEQGILGDSGLKGQKFSCLMKWPSASALAFCKKELWSVCLDTWEADHDWSFPDEIYGCIPAPVHHPTTPFTHFS